MSCQQKETLEYYELCMEKYCMLSNQNRYNRLINDFREKCREWQKQKNDVVF